LQGEGTQTDCKFWKREKRRLKEKGSGAARERPVKGDGKGNGGGMPAEIDRKQRPNGNSKQKKATGNPQKLTRKGGKGKGIAKKQEGAGRKPGFAGTVHGMTKGNTGTKTSDNNNRPRQQEKGEVVKPGKKK